MAHNIANKPELLNEILEYYKKPSYKNKTYTPKVIRPRRLKDEHCTEKYSHVWTFLLFAPQNEKVRFLFSSGSGYPILALIGVNNYHLNSVLFFRSIICPIDVKGYEKFRTLFFLLSMYPSKTTLKYSLTGLKRYKYDTKADFFNYSLKTYTSILSTKGHSSLKYKRRPQKWKEVILAYPKGDLPQWQKDFLNDVLKAIDEQEEKDAKTTE